MRAFELIDAQESSAIVVPQRSSIDRLVFDTVDEFDGQERLFMIPVAMDQEGKSLATVRSRLYRAISRAQV